MVVYVSALKTVSRGYVTRVSMCLWKNMSRDRLSIKVNIHNASRLIHRVKWSQRAFCLGWLCSTVTWRLGLIRVNGLNPPLQKMWGMFPFPVGRGLSEWEGFVCPSVEVKSQKQSRLGQGVLSTGWKTAASFWATCADTFLMCLLCVIIGFIKTFPSCA